MEMTGTLYVFGFPVLRGMYATSGEEVQQWYGRVPVWIRWATRMQWYATWTTPQEYRDATGEVKRKQSNLKLSGGAKEVEEAPRFGTSA